MLRENGGGRFFGEPAMDIGDFLLRTSDSRGMINILDARSLIADSRQYATFLLWLLSELFEELPESGDLAEPKIVFFFDEAHLLFRDIPQVLLEQVEKVVRLIRSRGVGIFFVTQNPMISQMSSVHSSGIVSSTPCEPSLQRIKKLSNTAHGLFAQILPLTLQKN